MFEDGNDYVRCILIDYSKAFDVINHVILLKELAGLRLHHSIYKWIASFFIWAHSISVTCWYIYNCSANY